MACTRVLTLLTLSAVATYAAPGTGPVDLARLELQGDGMAEDSVAQAVAAAARVLGGVAEVDPDRVWYLTGNAFAPVVNRAEDCASWWHVESQWGDRGVDTAAAALGLVAERVALPAGPADGTDAAAILACRQACVPPLRDAMARGAVLVALGGWEANAPHGFVPWGWAGIIAEVRDDGTILGACLNGRRDNPLRLPGPVWALRRGSAPAPGPEVVRRTLQLAIARIRGEGSFAAQGQACFGLAAMDALILQLRTVPGFCPGCHEREGKGWTDARDNLGWLSGAARVAEAGLRGAAGVAPEASRGGILAAAARYGRIQARLQPALSDQGPEPLRAAVGDLAKQQALAEGVLRPVRAELVLVAADLETALLAEGGTPVVQAAVVPAFAQRVLSLSVSDINATRTNLLMRLVCMQAMGDRACDYATLVVLSGHGNSFAYHPRKYWFMYSPPDDPETTERRLVRGTGFAWEVVPQAAAEGCWDTLCATVDSGRPLQAPWLDDYIFAGYCLAQAPDDRRVFALGGWREPGWMTWKDFCEWAERRGTFGRPALTPVPPDPGLAREVVGRLAEWAKGDGRAAVGFMKEGTFGILGLEAYARDVGDPAIPPEYFDGGWLACHAVNRQLSGRACTAAWLEGQAGLLPEAATPPLRRAASQYRLSDAAWQEFRAVLGGPEGSDLGSVQALWRDARRRADGAAALQRCATAERAAAAALAEAVVLLAR